MKKMKRIFFVLFASMSIACFSNNLAYSQFQFPQQKPKKPQLQQNSLIAKNTLNVTAHGLVVQRPESIGWPVETCVLGANYLITVAVLNSGIGKINNITVGLFDNNREIGRQDVRIIPSGGVQAAEFRDITFNAIGRHTIKTLIDPDNQIEESNERDNSRSVNINVIRSDIDLTFAQIAQGADRDLIVFNPARITAGSPFSAAGRVWNHGTQATGQEVEVIVFDNGRHINGTRIPAIAANSSREFEIRNVVIEEPGQHRLTFYIDNLLRIPEVNENNNSHEVNVQVLEGARPTARLEISSVETQPPSPVDANQPFAIHTTVNNSGNAQGTITHIEVLDNGAVLFNANLNENIPAEQRHSIITNIPNGIQQPGQHQISVRLTGSDNASYVSRPVNLTVREVRQPNIAITSVSALARFRDRNTPVTVTISGRNNGNAQGIISLAEVLNNNNAQLVSVSNRPVDPNADIAIEMVTPDVPRGTQALRVRVFIADNDVPIYDQNVNVHF